MPGQNWIFCGALLAALAVGAGALGAHFLKDRLRPPTAETSAAEPPSTTERPTAELYDQLVKAAGADRLLTYETAVRYQMVHAIGLILVGLLAPRKRSALLSLSGTGFLAGILLFSGGLYAWLFTGLKSFVHVVPIGGTIWIIAWLLLALAHLPRSNGDGPSETPAQ